jgi:hypothetical protein
VTLSTPPDLAGSIAGMADAPPRWSRAEEFYGRRGLAVPPPLTDAERAKFERDMDRADAEALRIYGSGHTAAA